MKKSIFFFAILLFLFSGCARVFQVKVDSLNGGNLAPGTTFAIMPGNQNVTADDLQFREFAGYLSNALKLNGYIPADDASRPDIEVYLSYGMGSAVQHVYSYNVPVYGQTGVHEYSFANTTPTASGGTTTFTNTVVSPDYGVTGYTTQTDTYTTYPKYIIIDAYDARGVAQGGQMKQIFKTSISADGKSQQLRKVLPFMLAASAKYIGTNTGEELKLGVSEDADIVTIIKTGMTGK